MATESDTRQLAILGFHKIGAPTGGEYPTWNYIPEATFIGFYRVPSNEQLASYRLYQLFAGYFGFPSFAS